MNTSAGHLTYDWINIELIHVKEPESYVLWCYRGTAIQTPLLATAVSPLSPPRCPAAPLPRCPAAPLPPFSVAQRQTVQIWATTDATGHCFSEITQPVFLVSQRLLGDITKKVLNLNFETAFISRLQGV